MEGHTGPNPAVPSMWADLCAHPEPYWDSVEAEGIAGLGFMPRAEYLSSLSILVIGHMYSPNN